MSCEWASGAWTPRAGVDACPTCCNTASLEGFPVERLRTGGQVMRLGVLVAGGLHAAIPVVHGQEELAIDEIAHVDGTVRKMVLHVIELVQEAAAIRFLGSRMPAFVPDRDGVTQRRVP